MAVGTNIILFACILAICSSPELFGIHASAQRFRTRTTTTRTTTSSSSRTSTSTSTRAPTTSSCNSTGIATVTIYPPCAIRPCTNTCIPPSFTILPFPIASTVTDFTFPTLPPFTGSSSPFTFPPLPPTSPTGEPTTFFTFPSFPPFTSPTSSCPASSTTFSIVPCPTTCFTTICQNTISTSTPTNTSRTTTISSTTIDRQSTESPTGSPSPQPTTVYCPRPTVYVPAPCPLPACANRNQRLCALSESEAADRVRLADGLVIPVDPRATNACGGKQPKVRRDKGKGGDDDDDDDNDDKKGGKNCPTVTKTLLDEEPTGCRFVSLIPLTTPSPCPTKCVNTCTVLETITAFV